MTIGIDRARLQGTILSGRSVDVNVYGAGVFDGWFGLGYNEKRERKLVQGSRRDLTPIGKTAGVYVPGAFTLKFAEQTAMMIKEVLAALEPNGTSFGDAEFDCTVALSEPDTVNAPVILYTFADCNLTSAKLDGQNTADELEEEFELMYVRSNVNGLTLFSSQT
jgi:hypothetical protein